MNIYDELHKQFNSLTREQIKKFCVLIEYDDLPRIAGFLRIPRDTANCLDKARIAIIEAKNEK